MKTLAPLLLMSATFLGANAYAQEPPGVLKHRPVVSQINSVTHLQVIREIRAVKAGGQLSFNEIGQPIAQAAGEVVASQVIRVEVVTLDVIGVHPSQDESRKTAFSAADEISHAESEKAATQIAANEAMDEPIAAAASAVDVIGIYPSGDESYKAAFSVVHAPRG